MEQKIGKTNNSGYKNIRDWIRKNEVNPADYFCGVMDSELVEKKITDLVMQNEKLLEIVEAVAHIGVDFGYGDFELQQEHIDAARKIVKDLQEQPQC